MTKQLRVAVVGGSIGGLTAACLLRDAAHDVTIFERSSTELEQRGAGIGLLEATSRYLVERAGVTLDEISISTDHIRYLNRDGSLAHHDEHRYLFSSWNTIYRRLLEHWIRADGSETHRYQLGHEMVGFDQDADGVTVHFAGERPRRGTNGTSSDRNARSGDRSQTFDLLVCADGVGSTARSILQLDAELGYAGYVAWRGIVPEHELPTDVADKLTDAVTYCVMANSHILVYPIPGLDGSVADGDRLMNFVWYRNYLEGAELDELLTDRNGVKRELSLPPGVAADHHVAEVKAVAAARLPALAAEVIARTAEPFLQVVYDIAVDQMAFGRVALIGDAAFAARPHAAAGSAKAADDGWTLVKALEDADNDPVEALRRWEVDQLALGRDLLKRSSDVGSRSQVSNTWQPDNPDVIFGLYAPGR